MSGADAIQVVEIINQIHEKYGLDCLPVHSSVLTGGDYNDIAHRINCGWTSSAIVQFIADKRGWHE